jgi:hypothetical protein
MHEHHHNSHHSCGNGAPPAYLYGYCHDSGTMRMMNMPDYMRNVQTSYTNMAQAPGNLMQQMAGMYSSPASSQTWQGHHRDKSQGCSCHDQHGKDECGCECCIRCADAVEYVRCGETRKIPITFDNDSRRERPVTLELGSLLTDSGRKLDWPVSLSETTFTLGPCGEKTVSLTVTVNCGQSDTTPGRTNGDANGATLAALESCLVGYLTVRADGCMIRPLVVAIAALPDRCGAHRIGCLCGCCC